MFRRFFQWVQVNKSSRLSIGQRLGLGAVALVLATPLVVACWLQPSPRGLGTHQQLGLPPCTIRVLYGVRCPTCGMTTSWSYLVRGRLFQAVRSNVGGTLLGILTMVTVGWLAVSTFAGRWIGWQPRANPLAWILIGVMVITLIDWSVRLWLDTKN